MQTLNLNSDIDLADAVPEVDYTAGFWRRQFDPVATETQRTFDWAYGVCVPLVCVLADPIVFDHDGFLAAYRPFAYLLSATSIMVMVAWLLWGKRLGWLAAPIGGLFIAGSIVSIIVGVILLPISLFGMLILIGFLGFTPLFSGLVYLRNGVRALRVSGTVLEKRLVWQAAILSGLFAVVIPYVINVQISRMVNEIVTADYNTMRRQAKKLSYVSLLVDAGPLSRHYYESTKEQQETPRMQELDRIHRQLTGQGIKHESGMID